MIEPNYGSIRIDPNANTTATILHEDYLQVVEKHLVGVELVLAHYKAKLEVEKEESLEHARVTLEDYDTMVGIIKNEDCNWYQQHRKPSKAWTEWNRDNNFNKNKWWFTKSRTVGVEPDSKLTVSKIALEEKIELLKKLFASWDSRVYNSYHSDVNSNIIERLLSSKQSHGTKRAIEDGDGHKWFLGEAQGAIKAANWTTFYVSHDIMIRLAIIDKFVEEKLKDIKE